VADVSKIEITRAGGQAETYDFKDPNAVRYIAQTLTDAQKTQARTNIGAGTSSFSGSYGDLTNAPPLVKGNGTGGNTIGGTGGTATNTTRYTNSVAYGDMASADANYAFAFGERAFAGNYNHSTGKHAVAIGNNVRAEKDYEIAYGKFNQSNADTAFSIGDGTSENDRHNLVELKTNGAMFLNGKAVKTEGGDDDDYYPMLGQVYAWYDTGRTYRYGFKGLTIYPVADIIFYSNDNDTTQEHETVFGDFRVRTSTSASQTTIYLIVPDGAVVDTSRPWIHVQNGYYLFNQCRITANITNAISKFDTSRVKNMDHMFSGIPKDSLSTLDLSSFDTRKVKTMERTFAGATTVTGIDLSSFDTSKVQNMTGMFYNCAALTNLDLSSFDMSNVTSYDKMFGEADYWAGITTLKTPKINPHDDIPLPITLYSQDGTAYTNLPVTTGTSIELRTSWT
jgi:surface protein